MIWRKPPASDIAAQGWSEHTETIPASWRDAVHPISSVKLPKPCWCIDVEGNY